MGKIESQDYAGTFADDEATKHAIFHKLLAWYQKHEAFHGECIMQSDDPQIEAAPLLAEIADELFKFDVTLKD